MNGNSNGIEPKHTISLYVANKPGVLIRIALVFARRGYNIDSLVVSEDQNPDFSRMTIMARGDRKTLVQIIQALNKLVDVVHATDHTGDKIIEREMALLKVNCSAEQRSEILQMAHVFNCETLDLSQDTVTFQVTGDTGTLDNVQTMFAPFGVIEMWRTGKVLIAPGAASTS